MVVMATETVCSFLPKVSSLPKGQRRRRLQRKEGESGFSCAILLRQQPLEKYLIFSLTLPPKSYKLSSFVKKSLFRMRTIYMFFFKKNCDLFPFPGQQGCHGHAFFRPPPGLVRAEPGPRLREPQEGARRAHRAGEQVRNEDFYHTIE